MSNTDLKANAGGDEKSGEVFQFLAFETCTRAQHGVYMENTSLVSPTSVVLLSADLSLSLSNSTKNNEEDDNMTNRAAFLVLRLNPYISIHVEAQNAVLFRLLRTRFADCFYKFVEEKSGKSRKAKLNSLFTKMMGAR